MNPKKHSVLLSILLLIVITCSAQTRDAGLWLGIKLEKKIHNWAELSLSEEIRFNENFHELGTAFTEMAWSSGWHSGFNAGIAYRFIQKRLLDDSYELRHRYHLELSYRYKFNRSLSLTLRERFQNQYKDVNRMADEITKEYALRSKLSLKYTPFKKISFDGSLEVYYQLNNPAGNEIDNLRYSVGTEYKLSKKQSLELYYLIDQELHVKDPWTSYILGLGYTFGF